MNPGKRRQFETRAQVLKALGHPSRLMMVDELSRGERCVCVLTELVGADISTVSKHLALLKEAGIVACEKRGLKVFYRLRVPCVIDFFDCLEAVEKGGICCRAARSGRGRRSPSCRTA